MSRLSRNFDYRHDEQLNHWINQVASRIVEMGHPMFNVLAVLREQTITLAFKETGGATKASKLLGCSRLHDMYNRQV